MSDHATLDLASFESTKGITHPPLVRDQDITGDCCSAGCSINTLSQIKSSESMQQIMSLFPNELELQVAENGIN